MTTKLIIVILRGGDCDKLIHQLLDAGYGVTKFSSMGGFFRRKSTTLLIGLPDAQVESALAMIRDLCPTPPDADEHSATVFVLNTNRATTM